MPPSESHAASIPQLVLLGASVGLSAWALRYLLNQLDPHKAGRERVGISTIWLIVTAVSDDDLIGTIGQGSNEKPERAIS